ncbi:MAG: hypothetical protein ACJAZS_000754 [Alteromonas naphthalenivorans]|jgi:hypothetical protein
MQKLYLGITFFLFFNTYCSEICTLNLATHSLKLEALFAQAQMKSSNLNEFAKQTKILDILYRALEE